jgi:hypothetical protein
MCDSVLPEDVECVAERGRRFDRDEIGRMGFGDGRRIEERLDFPEHRIGSDDADQVLSLEDGK